MRHRTDYKVTLGALPIARASFVTEVNQKNYTISGRFNSSAIVDIISKISAETKVSGTLNGLGMRADRYTLVYQSGKKKHTYDVR